MTLKTKSLAIRFLSFVLFVSFAGTAFTQDHPDWTMPFPAYRVIGNVYYVGSKGLASYIISTSDGLILINPSLESSVPLIRDSVEKLGFKFTDIKIVLISHAHFDHCAGAALLKQTTGAKYMVMAEDVPVVESGGKTDFQYGDPNKESYPPAKVDRILHDGDEVMLGNTVLIAHLTPGHTRGCTTWTFKVTDSGKTYDAVVIGSPNVNPGYKLVNNAKYPEIARDYERMWTVLKSLPCDIFLGAHGDYYGMEAKYAKMKDGGLNSFIDPQGYKDYVAQKEADFHKELKKEEKSERAH